MNSKFSKFLSLEIYVPSLNLRQLITSCYTIGLSMFGKYLRTLLYITCVISLFTGCEGIPDEIINTNVSDFRVVRISAPKDFQYIPGDSSFVTSIEFDQINSLKSIWQSIVSSDGSLTLRSMIPMADDGKLISSGDAKANDNIYSSIIRLSNSDPNGTYEISFYVLDNSGEDKKVGAHPFNYDNGQNNIPPVLSELIAPDTVIVTAPKSIIVLSVLANDENGLQDIENVYFKSYRPDGTTSGDKEFMFDDGNINGHGDETASDGRYSIIIEVLPKNTKGKYRFDFQAQDKGKKLSNIIKHNIFIL